MLYTGQKLAAWVMEDTQTVSLVAQYLFRQFANLSKKDADKNQEGLWIFVLI